MKFGPIPVSSALGAILAHSISVPDKTIKKGTCIDEIILHDLIHAGFEDVTVARLEETDCHENQAADRIAQHLSGPGSYKENACTGRSNLFAASDGLFILNPDMVDALNRLDSGLTLATLHPMERVEKGQMIATVKIIPFAINEETVKAAETLLSDQLVMSVAPFKPMRFGLVSTVLPDTREKVLDKTNRVLGARLELCGASLEGEVRVSHTRDDVAKAIGPLADHHDGLILFGASAVVDREDVIPSAIRDAGGTVSYFGMPVDPGNLLLIGELNGKPVIGAPGCARSPKENGFDWVLQRVLANIPVGPDDIQKMGVGGLLKEISSRPHPRREKQISQVKDKPCLAGLVLAAGQSRRMGRPNKLFSTLDGKTFVRHVVDAATSSELDQVIVVTGHDHERLAGELASTSAILTHNPEYADGLSTSLKAGISALGDDVDGVVVLLSDMPFVSSEVIRQIMSAYDPDHEERIIVPHFKGQRGNPVLWSRRYFRELIQITGDQGARSLFKAYPDAVFELELEEAVLIDVDTQERVVEVGASLDTIYRDNGDC